jgi:hypothetical protein
MTIETADGAIAWYLIVTSSGGGRPDGIAGVLLELALDPLHVGVEPVA